MANQTLKGKVLVMGAGAKNLGGLISRTFGADGASVVVHYNSDKAIDRRDRASDQGRGGRRVRYSLGHSDQGR